jgi:S-adenosylmethionine:tRNA ribosyltransferase-isomerase
VKTSDFNYHLPRHAIAQHPASPRDSSRLLVYDRSADRMDHTKFSEIHRYLKPGDLLVINDTRVIPARLHGKKARTGGKVELLLLEKEGPRSWQAWVGGSGLVPGREVVFEDGLTAAVTEQLEGPLRRVAFNEPVEPHLSSLGEMPLPPYIEAELDHPDQYQTVYAAQPGSSAAPTAGLHFTPQLISRLKSDGIRFQTVTLQIGLDTFAPVHEEDPREHPIHTEYCQLSAEAARDINQTSRRGGRIIAVGTTSVRTLETAAAGAGSGQRVAAFRGATDLFILPGYEFQAVDALITNFHLPGSTLLMLVSALVGREKLLEIYQTAVQQGYRFYSFGDAMLVE